MQHEQELFADEGVDGPQRMLLVVLVAFDVEAVVVAEVHGEDVVRHVGHAVPDDKVGGQPVPATKQHTKHSTCELNIVCITQEPQDRYENWSEYQRPRLDKYRQDLLW